jgi:hypothetical protein
MRNQTSGGRSSRFSLSDANSRASVGNDFLIGEHSLKSIPRPIVHSSGTGGRFSKGTCGVGLLGAFRHAGPRHGLFKGFGEGVSEDECGCHSGKDESSPLTGWASQSPQLARATEAPPHSNQPAASGKTQRRRRNRNTTRTRVRGCDRCVTLTIPRQKKPVNHSEKQRRGSPEKPCCENFPKVAENFFPGR